MIRVRLVRLWGQDVLINEQDHVYCPDCFQFLAVEELGAPDNYHRVGIRRPGVTFPMKNDDEPRGHPGPAGMQW
ncbi:hypothetical protein [Nocardioides marmorisolisilvae]|uniref:hypothetical protein n=1 Tax=Nocardioides marmorisolisilvae TaxID=1542737 RepID=UPI0011CEA301|nr:hypothetical protein [Nocardioides marmorisolisilvae]